MKLSETLPAAVIAASCVWCGPAAATGDVGQTKSTLEDDLVYFSELFEGEFSNFADVVAAEKAGEEAGGGGMQRHYVYRRVDLPAFGDHVVYVQQYYEAGDDPSLVYRQRIYQSYADHERNEIVTRIYSFPEGEEAVALDAQYDPSKLSGYAPEGMPVLPDGCEIFWYRDGENIIGYQKPGVCVMTLPNTDITMLLADDLILTHASFSTRTRANDEDGNLMFGDEKPMLMHKAAIYDCNITLQGGSATKRARIHDQGGQFLLGEIGGNTDARLRLQREDATDPSSSLRLDLLSDSGEVATSSSAQPSQAKFSTDLFDAQCSVSETPWSQS